MTDSTEVTATVGGDLVIAIRNKEPLGVDAVADLLRALGDDYRTWSGGRSRPHMARFSRSSKTRWAVNS